MRSLTGDGHAGIDVHATSNCTETIVCATRTHDVLDEKGRRTCEPASIVQRRFEFPWNSVECFTKEFREPCSLRGTGGIFAIELLGGFAVHEVCHGVVGFIMNDDTEDCGVEQWQVAPARQSHEVRKRFSYLFWQTQVYHFTFHAAEGSH